MTTATSGPAGYPARYFAAWNQRGPATTLDVITATVHWEDPPLPDPITNHEQIGEFFAAGWTGFPDMAFHTVCKTRVDSANHRVAQEHPRWGRIPTRRHARRSLVRRSGARRMGDRQRWPAGLGARLPEYRHLVGPTRLGVATAAHFA